MIYLLALEPLGTLILGAFGLPIIAVVWTARRWGRP